MGHPRDIAAFIETLFKPAPSRITFGGSARGNGGFKKRIADQEEEDTVRGRKVKRMVIEGGFTVTYC